MADSFYVPDGADGPDALERRSGRTLISVVDKQPLLR